MTQSKVAAIVLAAGASTRLGRPKQLALLGGERLLDRAVRIASEAGCVSIVVLGFEAEHIAAECDLSHCRVVVNDQWQHGMGASIQVAATSEHLVGIDKVVVMTCDQPAVTPGHLRALIAATGHDEPVASLYAGRRGVPACFPASCVPLLAGLARDSGARDLLVRAQTVALPLGELDIDTEEKLRVAEQTFGVS